MELFKLTTNPEQSGQLIELGISPVSFMFHIQENGKWLTKTYGGSSWFTSPLLPAWTKAEIDVMIGPLFRKADFWETSQATISRATDPLTFPVFFLDKVIVFHNPAQASAAGLIYLLENRFIEPSEARSRYEKIFLSDGTPTIETGPY